MISGIVARVQRRDGRWHMSVMDGDMVILEDHGRDLGTVHEIATRAVGTFRDLKSKGHTFRPWAELLAEAKSVTR